ncbi:TPA: ABC transporter substrate-binding protein [Streptococcus pneumoniae]
MWHSFTQGPRLESIQKSADAFMQKHPKTKIKIETFSWNDFYTKWTTGLANGNVPDISTALPNQVMEMVNSDALVPLNDSIKRIGQDKFNETALNEAKIGDDYYSVPLYSHAQVMWVRTDLLKEHNIEVPKTWDQLYEASKKLKEAGVYGLSVPFGTNDLMATRFLNFYVRSGGGSLLTKDLKADLTSQLAQDGIKYWVKLYKEISPQDSLNFNVLQQATLFYQGKTAFDFNSGFHIGGINANSPQLIDSIDAYPIPKIKESDKDQGIETSNIPMVVWKNSKHPEVAKAFLEALYKVVLPIVAPGIVATAIYTFINAWNEFLYALILINNTGKMTVAVALRSLNGSEILDWGDMMAASVIVVLPSIIFFSIIQNKIASGLSEGSVK